MVPVSGVDAIIENPSYIRRWSELGLKYANLMIDQRYSYIVAIPEDGPVVPWCFTGVGEPGAQVRVTDNKRKDWRCERGCAGERRDQHDADDENHIWWVSLLSKGM